MRMMVNKGWLILLLGVWIIGCGSQEKVGVISTDYGDIVLEFYPDVAPKHVENFQLLANEGFYDGTRFHRVIPGFVIQGGDPNSKNSDRSMHGEGGRAGKYFGLGDENNPDTWTLPSEFNARPHKRGALSMARAADPNSAGSQFFICAADVFRLDNKYTVFGEVIKGMDVVDHIVNLPRDDRDNPFEPATMIVSIVAKSSIEGLE